MGKRGPKPKPKPNVVGIKPPATRPSPPDHLCEEEVAVFEDLVDRMMEVPGLLTTFDEHPIAAMAEAWCTYRRSVLAIRRDGTGETQETKTGARRHPEALARDAAIARFLTLAHKYGFTPGDREGLTKTVAPGSAAINADPLAGLSPVIGSIGGA